MINQLILVDGNNVGFAGMANPRLRSGEHDTQAIFTVIRKIRSIVADNPDSYVVVLWDGYSWRKNAFKEYKANREQTDKQESDREKYFDQSVEIRLGLSLLGVTQVHASNMEADDLAEVLTKKWIARSENHSVLLYSGDKDWLQLVQRRVTWYDFIRVRRCSITNFKEFTGYKDTKQFVDAKCVLGDSGDNVKGINGVGPKMLEKIYTLYDSFNDLLLDHAKGELEKKWTFGKLPKVLKELDVKDTLAKMQTNSILMDLSTPMRPAYNLIKDQKPLDELAFETFCYKHAFLSFIKDYDRFLLPFRENKYIKSN